MSNKPANRSHSKDLPLREEKPFTEDFLDVIKRKNGNMREGICLTVLPNMTPPGWEPLAGIASDSAERHDAFLDLIERAMHSGRVEGQAEGFAAGREKGRAELLEVASVATHISPLHVEGIVAVEAGFSYRGKTHDLNGRPLAMLKAILGSPNKRISAEKLRQKMGIDDAKVEWPVQAVKDAAKKLRRKLKKALEDAGVECNNPLASIGRGVDLTYQLILP